MPKDRIVSIGEAAALRGLTEEAIIKAIASGRLFVHQLSGKGYMLSERQVLGRSFDKQEFQRMCRQYVSVPEACNIVWKTDAAVMRDIRKGRIKGFRLNSRCWAVLKASAEDEFRDYLENGRRRVGRPRAVGETRSPRDLRRKILRKR